MSTPRGRAALTAAVALCLGVPTAALALGAGNHPARPVPRTGWAAPVAPVPLDTDGSASVDDAARADTAGAARATGVPGAPAALPTTGGFDYQLGGSSTPPPGVGVVTRDRTAAPAPGLYDICYVNGFQVQPQELSWWRRNHPGALLTAAGGGYVVDPDWDEVLLDTSSDAERQVIASVVGGWIDGCAAHGYQAVEPDNLDSFTRSGGRLSVEDNVALARLLIARAHSDGLAIGQKNTAELGSTGPSTGFDFAVAEECEVYDECGSYTGPYGSRVLEVEYTDNGATAFRNACASEADHHPVVLRDRDLVPQGQDGYSYASC